ncbi:transglycosylase family protein [Streptomyces sp. IB2014 016-6]|uniref:transglycosylase family protein n=1 Tax=Streptomyces sp. IB2014 016-6 TaxID=2517818 RepID=UPI0011CA0F70|nr:transglycosylase family protein [Streptomyces sp. IB2014 016-6]TXL86817.1 LysM peptidoglycan-binding domain-containing protein [Streptomyces sp. IB2014 016-6]
MRSGNGRHRRPRQAPALVVAAGVTGSAIAIPLLGATGASAADATTWDRVAECESGGMWSADLGNGYYGGLQISQETWADFGGTAYAPTADQASRSQQIAVAEKILAAQGPAAWPTCALITGLTADADTDSEPSGEATEKPEAPAEPEPDETAVLPAAPESTPPSGQFGRDSASGAEKPAAGESSPEPSTEASTGQGKHRGEPAPESDATTGSGKSAEADPDGTDGSTEAGKPGKSGEERESGRHASRGDDSARGDAAEDGSYTVRAGDNLWAIADEQKVEGGWPALYEANREVVGSDADLILPGQSLDLTANQG